MHRMDPTLTAMLATLRQTLHRIPERAGDEVQTAATVAQFLGAYAPDMLMTEVGGHGVVAVFAGAEAGPTVLVRADLDAVPAERDEHHIGANRDSTRHTCGHDGHMTIVAGLGALLAQSRPPRGRIVLLFQPAEETGQGAQRVLADARFRELAPDFGIGFHNLPGYPRETVVVRTGTIASASVGMYARFVGQASHAAEPEAARSPRLALGRLMTALPELSSPANDEAARARDDYRLLTVTHARLGRESFGVTPGSAELLATLRATTHARLAGFREEAERLVRQEAARVDVDIAIDWVDDFRETENAPAMVRALEAVAGDENLPVDVISAPFAWSDDFGQFAAEFPSVYFGLGIGAEADGLHQPGYEFPDGLIPTGTHLIERLARRVLDGVAD